MKKHFLIFPLLSSILFSCKSQSDYNYPIEYNLNLPSQKLVLDDELNEISGISLDEKNNQFIGIADEKGILYFIDASTGTIQKRLEFHKDGDYEDIELIGDDLYILKSSGTLYLIKDRFQKEKAEFEKFNTALEVSNDVEGLCYDKRNNKLLLACKASPTLDAEVTNMEQERAIYSFNLKTKALSEDKPVLITREQFLKFIEENPDLPKAKKWKTRFGAGAENFDFEPSAIAIQESTGRYYVLSSVGKMLAVFNPNWELHTLIKLDKEKFLQPEGICFDQSENLYICNEGKTEQAIIYKFERK
jgi:uncharacterized protein YjiK